MKKHKKNIIVLALVAAIFICSSGCVSLGITDPTNHYKGSIKAPKDDTKVVITSNGKSFRAVEASELYSEELGFKEYKYQKRAFGDEGTPYILMYAKQLANNQDIDEIGLNADKFAWKGKKGLVQEHNPPDPHHQPAQKLCWKKADNSLVTSTPSGGEEVIWGIMNPSTIGLANICQPGEFVYYSAARCRPLTLNGEILKGKVELADNNKLSDLVTNSGYLVFSNMEIPVVRKNDHSEFTATKAKSVAHHPALLAHISQ
jgi:hypothetical protein